VRQPAPQTMILRILHVFKTLRRAACREPERKSSFLSVDKHSLAKLKKLLKWADDAHIVTEVLAQPREERRPVLPTLHPVGFMAI
jgi:hypothetical protein